MIDPRANADRLVRSTVKIIAQAGGKTLGEGSGLLMQLKIFGPTTDQFVAVVVTNKHVVEGAEQLQYRVPGANGGPAIISQSPAEALVKHPDSGVDLCVMPVAAPLLQHGLHDAEFISSDDIWRMDRLQALTAIENIVMIGYPNGLLDSHALYPIARRGITATPAFADLNGDSEFMIDCACFPGSSGSPVFLFDQGSHVDKSNNYQFGSTRFGLLGFLHAGPALNEHDLLVSMPPPGELSAMRDYPLMMNLGNCVRAERLFDMFDAISEAARPPTLLR